MVNDSGSAGQRYCLFFWFSNGSAGGSSSALKDATGVRMATEVPGNVSASWRSLGFSFCNGSALELKVNGSAFGVSDNLQF
jgi:hypothetical protein